MLTYIATRLDLLGSGDEGGGGIGGGGGGVVNPHLLHHRSSPPGGVAGLRSPQPPSQRGGVSGAGVNGSGANHGEIGRGSGGVLGDAAGYRGGRGAGGMAGSAGGWAPLGAGGGGGGGTSLYDLELVVNETALRLDLTLATVQKARRSSSPRFFF